MIRKLVQLTMRTLTWVIIVALVAAWVGQIARDRAPMPISLLMYVPLLPIAIVGLAMDAVQRGRGILIRFGLSVISLFAVIWVMWNLIGTFRTPDAKPAATDLRIVQWNVRYGGGDFPSMENDLLALKPNLIILNEAPRNWHVKELLGRLGPQWSMCTFEKPWMHLTVCAPTNVNLEQTMDLSNGNAMVANTIVSGQPLRILVADGVSNPRVLRTPFLSGVEEECERYKNAGTPIDIVAGDFNSIGRSAGFDRFAGMAGGYALASDQCHGWVGTYPSWCPLYDIDHVWIRKGLTITSCRFFGNKSADHRGQIVTLRTG